MLKTNDDYNTKILRHKRKVWELHQTGKLASYLRAALRRERLMLGRKRDLDRIIRRKVPEEYFADLAGVYGDDPDPFPSPEQAEEYLAIMEGEDVPAGGP